MRQKLLLYSFLFFLVLVLAGLNAASYVQKETTPDTESEPNRSTYNFGSTGTAAFYALLAETGRGVVRWQRPIDALLTETGSAPATFIVVGTVRREMSAVEARQLLEWVSGGGRLILIDRAPSGELQNAGWPFSFSQRNEIELFSADPADRQQMIGKASAAKPVQPTRYGENVIAVQPSQFAASIGFERGDAAVTDSVDPEISNAPVVHLAAGEINILASIPYGGGEIVYLSDPYIVSNAGIGVVDNARLAVNIAAPGDGLIAFDEYHQGYGSNNNRFLEFFAGTPVVTIFLQFALLGAVILYSQSRRFARALPAREPDRLSKLEYISAMAQLLLRTKAYDLAIESIYKDFHRRAAALFGVDNTTVKRQELAALIAERIAAGAGEIDQLMFECEDIISGEPANRKTTLRLVKRLREVEGELGLKRAGRRRI